MRTTEYIKEIDREIAATEKRLEALRQAHEGLITLKALSNGASAKPAMPKDAGTGTRAVAKAKKTSTKGTAVCSICGKDELRAEGPGSATAWQHTNSKRHKEALAAL